MRVGLGSSTVGFARTTRTSITLDLLGSITHGLEYMTYSYFVDVPGIDVGFANRIGWIVSGDVRTVPRTEDSPARAATPQTYNPLSYTRTHLSSPFFDSWT